MGLTTGTAVGPYEILGPIGAGGMGEVYRARDPRIGRDVAVKVLPAASSEPERQRRFEQEARASGALNHPNVLVVYDVGTNEGAPYIVSELLAGETLRSRMGGTALPVRKCRGWPPTRAPTSSPSGPCCSRWSRVGERFGPRRRRRR